MHNQSSVIVALDIDRTLLDTTYLLEKLYEQSLMSGADRAIIDQLKVEEIASRGNNFDLISQLDSYSALPSVESMYQYTDNILYRGVKELLDQLMRSQMQFVLLTYGTQLGQSYKIKLIEHALGEELSFHITDEPNKAAWLESIETDGTFAIHLDNRPSVLKAQEVILIDDKESNLQTLHPHIRTILVDNSVMHRSSDGISIAKVWNAITSNVSYT
jgi:hypothetical protein